MDPREVAIAILGDHHQQMEISKIEDMVDRNISEQLPAAAAASMAALKREEGCSTVLDFFSRLSSRRSSSSSTILTTTNSAASRAEQDIYTTGFKLIILAHYDIVVHGNIDGGTIVSALRWDPDSVDYIREKGYGRDAVLTPNLIHVVEDPTLRWGIDALFFFLSQAQYEQIVNRGLLATIPPVTALCLSSFTPWPGEIDLCKVLLASPNFTHLLVTITLTDNRRFWLTMDTQEVFQTSTSLHSLFIGNMTHYPRDIAWRAPATALASHPSLTSFTLFGLTQLSSLSVIMNLFRSAFLNNPLLTSLSFVSTKMLNDLKSESQLLYFRELPLLFDDSRKAVLDGLRRHGTLHQVSFDGTPPLDGDPVIAAQLKKNAEQADRIKLFKAEGFKQVRPSTVRIYLCGLPLSGKTSVSRSLAKWSKGSLHPWSQLKGIKVPERTRGIEVTIIESPLDHQRISVWDMAGQLEYHSFHDSMLPDLGDLAIPSLFLFVWNPFKMNEEGKYLRDVQGGRVLVKHPNDFRDDFKYWLKFLASKTPKSNVLRPNVVVVVTRADLSLPDMKVELHSVFESLRVEFEDYILLDMEGFFQVDARDPKKVSRLGSHLFKCTKAILEEAINDFSICDEARNLFAGWIRKGMIPPLITKERFFCLTQQELGIHEEMCEAVARSLNDSGDVIFLPTLELVVMDTKWFCQKIMGDILHFDVKSVGIFTHHSSNGFFTPHYLERLLEEELNINSSQGSKWTISRTRDLPNSKESMKVAGCDLVKLLVGLQLACPIDNTQKDSDIFLPASLCGKARENRLPDKYLKLDDPNASYVGRRLIVRDSKRTFLTPGIFPRLQVTLHNMLTTRDINVELEQDVIAFADAGSRVLVEFCALEGKDNFIDILVCSRHTSDEALEWVYEKVIAEMMKVFAHPRGIPGVDLMHSVIQPACIRGLVEASQRQAVPIQVLRGILREHIQKKGAKLLVDGTTNVIYTWQTKPLVDDDVVRLLGETEVVKIIGAYMTCLSETAKDVLDLSIEKKNSKQKKRPEFGTTESQKQMEALFNLVQATYEMTREVRMDVKEIKVGMKRLSQQVEDLCGAVLPRLCELFTFAKEGEAGKLPRMFVVTEDNGGLVRRVVCSMVPGLHKLRLELPCECRTERAHLVDGQSGLSITTLDEGLVKCGLPYIHAFLKVAYAATKIAAHVAVGCNDYIPDFTGVLASIVDAPEFGPSEPFSDFTDSGSFSSRMDLSSGQQWLFKVLSDCDCTTSKQIYAHFGLSRIRYADSAVAWVCDKHCSEGAPCPP